MGNGPGKMKHFFYQEKQNIVDNKTNIIRAIYKTEINLKTEIKYK